MRHVLEPIDLQFLGDLNRLGKASIREIGTAMNVTATAVRQRLVRLQVAGLISRSVIRNGRGRPHHAYSLTPAGLRHLGDNYSDLAMILWRELKRIPDQGIQLEVTNRIRDAMVQRFGRSGGQTVTERLNGLVATLLDRGFDVESVEENGLRMLRENSCPYQELAAQDRSVCDMELQVFESVLGASLLRTKCCLDGHNCCEFEPVGLASPDRVGFSGGEVNATGRLAGGESSGDARSHNELRSVSAEVAIGVG